MSQSIKQITKNAILEVDEFLVEHQGDNVIVLDHKALMRLEELIESKLQAIRAETLEDCETYMESSAPAHGISLKEFIRIKNEVLENPSKGENTK